MTGKDLEQVRRWLVSGATLEEVESVSRYGLVGNERFTESARRLYVFLWTWGAAHFSGRAGLLQERAYARLGAQGLQHRFQRCNALAAKLKEGK